MRLDIKLGEHQVWAEEGTYPGEPIFVPRPGGNEEDDGVLLSVVLAGQRYLDKHAGWACLIRCLLLHCMCAILPYVLFLGGYFRSCCEILIGTDKENGNRYCIGVKCCMHQHNKPETQTSCYCLSTLLQAYRPPCCMGASAHQTGTVATSLVGRSVLGKLRLFKFNYQIRHILVHNF